MSAHVLFNLLKELRKRDKMRGYVFNICNVHQVFLAN